MAELLICRIASLQEMNIKWDYEMVLPNILNPVRNITRTGR